VKRRAKLLLWIPIAVLLIGAYPTFVLGYTWSHVSASSLPGGRRGPLDAYRHTLASAVVAYTLSPKAVDLVTAVMERRGRKSNLMDRHNNRIGAAIGLRAKSLSEAERMVSAQVLHGAVNATDPDQITWLPQKWWAEGSLW
jgi:hypothetical protein